VNTRDRLDRLEAAIGGDSVDDGEPCEACGAPAATRREAGLVVVINDGERCEGCGRSMRDGVPFVAGYRVHIIRPDQKNL